MTKSEYMGYTQTRTIAMLALVGVILLAVGVAASMGTDDDSAMIASPRPDTVMSPSPTASPHPTASPNSNQDDESDTPSETEAELARIVDNPESYMNQQVTVTGEVNTVYTDRAFLIDGPGLINDTLLVVSRTAFDQEVLEDRKVQMDGNLTVSGRVQRFNRIELGNSLNVLLPENQYGQFEGDAYLLVEQVEME